MNDRDVRDAVLDWLGEIHTGDDNTRIVQEMGIWSGSVRIDIAVINGELHGFELKSERDTLERLPAQAALYSQVFDRVTLVVAEKHAEKAVAIVPDWWGVSLASGRADQAVGLAEARAPLRNPAPDPVQIARLFWRAEALDVLERHGLIRGFRSKPADVLAHRLAAELSLVELRNEARAALKARSGWLGKVAANDGRVSVKADAYPALTTARFADAGQRGDLLDTPVAPATWDLTKAWVRG